MVGGALELGDVVGSVLAQDSDARSRRLGGLARNGSLKTPVTAVVRRGGCRDCLVGWIELCGAV
jgi:hypothetical protein